MMKKIYLMPETEVIKVTLTAIIAASDPDVTVNEDETIEAGAVESRRRNSVWEDEEEF